MLDPSLEVLQTFLEVIVMEDGKSSGRLADPASTNKGEWSEVFGQAVNLLDRLIASNEDLRWWRWWQFQMQM